MMNAMTRLQPGQQLDRYLLESEIGTGGMGIVYRAQHQLLGTWVALKVLDPRLASDVRFVQRFAIEAQTAARLQHPNIVKVFDVGQAEGWYFIVMEFLDGAPLDRWLRERQRCSLQEAAGIIGQVAAALDHAHAYNLVHRDVKPANIMLRSDGHATLMDFGLVRAGDGIGLTLQNQVLGTPEYMSPEQAQGQRATKYSDIYALGIVAYKLITGAVPFSGNTPVSTMRMHIDQALPPLHRFSPDAPAALEPVIAQALAKQPTQRFQRAGEFAQRLQQAIAEPPPLKSTPLAKPTPASAAPARRDMVSLVMWIVLLLLLFVLALLISVVLAGGSLHLIPVAAHAPVILL
jgi:serine/threonine-protein kinase